MTLPSLITTHTHSSENDQLPLLPIVTDRTGFIMGKKANGAPLAFNSL